MKQVISTTNAPAAIGPYSQAVASNGLIFISGQLGIDPKTGNLAEGGVEAQAKQSMENIKAILTEAGVDFSNILKTTIFIADMADFAVVNAVYERYFNGTFPARSTIQVAALPKSGLVEIEVIAMK